MPDPVEVAGTPGVPPEVEMWPIDRLAPYPGNPRDHAPEQVAKVAASIVEFGWTVPILADDDGEVIAGHGRLLAARHLGLDHVPVIRLGHLTPDQVRAYRIADNRLTELSAWNPALLAAEFTELTDAGYDLGLTGFTDADLEALLAPVQSGGIPADRPTLAERFGVPPFTVLNAREGWWQDRKRAWIDLGIRSEVGRGENCLALSPEAEDYRQRRGDYASRTGGLTWGDAPQVTEPGLNYYRNREKAKDATPGKHAMPAADYSKSKGRGDGRGRVIPGAK